VWDATYSYKYDEDGRVIERNLGEGNATNFEWDDEGRLRIQTGNGAATFEYDASGQRVIKQVGGATWLYVSAEYEVDLTAGKHQKHIFVMGQRALSIQQNGIGDTPNPPPPASLGELQFHLFGDQLGSQRIVTDASGAIQQRTVIAPYGEWVHAVDGCQPPQDLLDYQSKTPFLFTGHRYDVEADLHYMGARYYDPLVGRFLSTDPELIGPTAGVTFGRIGSGAVHASGYAYAMNRPTAVIDPTGRSSYEVWITEGDKTRRAKPGEAARLGPLALKAGQGGTFTSRGLSYRVAGGQGAPAQAEGASEEQTSPGGSPQATRKGEQMLSTPHGRQVVGQALQAAHNDRTSRMEQGDGDAPSGTVIREKDGKLYVEPFYRGDTGRWVAQGNQMKVGVAGHPTAIRNAAGLAISVGQNVTAQDLNIEGLNRLSVRRDNIPIFVSTQADFATTLIESGFPPLDVTKQLRGQ
jgi:RHS repeat-associated protein